MEEELVASEPVASATSKVPENDATVEFEETQEGEDFLRMWTLGNWQ